MMGFFMVQKVPATYVPGLEYNNVLTMLFGSVDVVVKVAALGFCFHTKGSMGHNA